MMPRHTLSTHPNHSADDSKAMLSVFGPYEVPFEKQSGAKKYISEGNVQRFWNHSGIKQIACKRGCYIFALKAGKGYTPWYVGKTTRSLEKECLQPFQLNRFNDFLVNGVSRGGKLVPPPKGSPVMFFVAPAGSRYAVSSSILRELETFLIQAAKDENPKVLNRNKTSCWGIKGVFRSGQGKPHKNASGFRRMMNL